MKRRILSLFKATPTPHSIPLPSRRGEKRDSIRIQCFDNNHRACYLCSKKEDIRIPNKEDEEKDQSQKEEENESKENQQQLLITRIMDDKEREREEKEEEERIIREIEFERYMETMYRENKKEIELV